MEYRLLDWSYIFLLRYGYHALHNWKVRTTITYASILEVYTLEDILELNDKTEEDCLEYLVDQGYVKLPQIQPLEFE